MKITSLALAALLLTTSAGFGQDEQSDPEDGASDLIEEGLRLFFRGMIEEMDPALEDFRDFARELDPVVQEWLGIIGDVRNYHKPEVLPNGDIIIRRKSPEELELDEEGDVEI